MNRWAARGGIPSGLRGPLAGAFGDTGDIDAEDRV